MPDFTKGAAWMDGQIIPVADAKISVLDWGLTHSDITYDVVPVWNGSFFRLPDYLARFRQSLAALQLTIPQTPEEITTILHRMVARSGLRQSYVSMVASRGVPMVAGSRDPRDCANHFYAWCVPYVHIAKPELAERGVHLWISKSSRRIPEDSVNPRAKNYHWGDFTTGLLEAKQAGFDNTALLDHDGNVTEGPGFNIFALKGNTIVTSDHGVLHGITRRTMIELCEARGLAVETRPLPLAELMEADEVFMSSSGGGAIPVTRVDDRVFSNDSPGPVARSLRADYFALLERGDLSQPITY
ncbi:aminotransferase class IV [Alisedimentitalea sp. MJ-SS2]|uniref:aminotransferase class IV n=1 Tax=Aliisedimentitalea sp. MJ-SS2 TaxID=3049795 RepID=UPI0029134C41|nr:aminotransferase class IV [Alisedimentitalea sp. MJ-SS2]MDU8926370.1 aminotransferase class IV [Alisedimentitalea sp. MJ-SS2]